MRNIEEDIKVLKNIQKLRRIEFKHCVTDREERALENILAEREQDKKRIKELEEELEKANRQLDLDYVDENFIPKQAVIDLIENETIDISGFECIAVEDLQELLEGEEVKNVK